MKRLIAVLAAILLGCVAAAGAKPAVEWLLGDTTLTIVEGHGLRCVLAERVRGPGTSITCVSLLLVQPGSPTFEIVSVE